MNPSCTLARRQVLAFAFFAASASSFAQSDAAKALRVVLKGHDPVAYFSDGKPVMGDAKFSFDFDGERYLFASAANRDKFAADPDRYAPQFAGYCTGSMAGGVRNEADPEAWIIADGKLYLFGQVKFRDTAKNDPRYLTEKVALAREHWRTKRSGS